MAGATASSSISIPYHSCTRFRALLLYVHSICTYHGRQALLCFLCSTVEYTLVSHSIRRGRRTAVRTKHPTREGPETHKRHTLGVAGSMLKHLSCRDRVLYTKYVYKAAAALRYHLREFCLGGIYNSFGRWFRRYPRNLTDP